MKIEKAIDILIDIQSSLPGEKEYEPLGLAISALEDKLNGGWIPVSEGSPIESDIYLVTFMEDGKRYTERFYYSTLIGWMMPVAWQDEGRIDNIIAWQPLPEPYKEVENE